MPLHQKILTALIVPVLLAILAGCQLVQLPSHTAAGGEEQVVSEDAQVAEIIRVVDGDTIAVVPTDALPATNQRGTEHYVRLLGIDAPEMNKLSDEPAQCGAQEATAHLAELLHGQQTVTLFFDRISDHTDRFGRSLAYVETAGNASVDVGLQQLQAGLAEAWYPKNEPAPERFEIYSAAQHAAQRQSAGSFGTCTSVGR